MGRWAQRSRGGGGTTLPLNFITEAAKQGGAIVDGQYARALTVSALVPTAFLSSPSGKIGQSILDLGDGAFEITFNGNVAADTGMTYSGHTPGVLTPQIIFYL